MEQTRRDRYIFSAIAGLTALFIFWNSKILLAFGVKIVRRIHGLTMKILFFNFKQNY